MLVTSSSPPPSSFSFELSAHKLHLFDGRGKAHRLVSRRQCEEEEEEKEADGRNKNTLRIWNVMFYVLNPQTFATFGRIITDEMGVWLIGLTCRRDRVTLNYDHEEKTNRIWTSANEELEKHAKKKLVGIQSKKDVDIGMMCTEMNHGIFSVLKRSNLFPRVHIHLKQLFTRIHLTWID